MAGVLYVIALVAETVVGVLGGGLSQNGSAAKIADTLYGHRERLPVIAYLSAVQDVPAADQKHESGHAADTSPGRHPRPDRHPFFDFDAAVTTAAGIPHVSDTLTACRESGHSAGAISAVSEQAVTIA